MPAATWLIMVFLERSFTILMVCLLIKIILIAGRRPCPAGTCCSGFSVLRCLGRACTLVAPTLLAFARRVAASSQALKNAPTATFFTAPPSHPLHCCACRGASAAKTLTRPRRSTGNQDRALSGRQHQAGYGLSKMSSRSRRVFLAGGPSHAKQCEGCGGGRAMDTAEGVSLSACSEPYHGAAERSEGAAGGRVREVRARPRDRHEGASC